MLLTEGKHGVLLWDVRNVSHPVLDSTFKVDPAGEMGFLSDQLIAVNVRPSPSQSDLKLWDITNPRRPVAGGEVPNGDPESVIVYSQARRLLTQNNGTGSGSGANTALWSLRDPRKPTPLDPHLPMDPNALNVLNGDTWVALTSDKDALDVLDVSNPSNPVVTAGIPVGGTYENAGLSVTDSPGGWLTGSDFTPTGTTDQVIYLTQVRADGKAVSDYVQLPTSAGSLFTFSPDGKSVATNLNTSYGSGLGAFYPQGPESTGLGILYPLNSDSVYEHLCSTAGRSPQDPSWSRYLPATYYRPACS
jgi:hypothetical protein